MNARAASLETAEFAAPEVADVCIVVEGCYPYVSGGVANWLDWLIRSQPNTSFSVVAIVADDREMTSRYGLPGNVVHFENLPLSRKQAKPMLLREPRLDPAEVADIMCRVLEHGDPAAFASLCAMMRLPAAQGGRIFGKRADGTISLEQLTSSRFAWNVMSEVYDRLTPAASFPDFFWAWRTLVGGLFSVLTSPMPAARCYHTISTGYAGLFAARAAIETGRRVAITEHGIYTNERRIDLTSAEWIADSVAFSLSRIDDRMDIRQFWTRCFESYARLCYDACTRITTLYGENQSFQTALGAPREKLEVIPNGIETTKFSALERVAGRSPTVALIGRVVPIKDIKTYIAAVARLKAEYPDLVALLLGPTDEDPEYFRQCVEMARELGLEGTLRFTGKVDIIDYMTGIDVMVLTSISEAQPLVLLEAGAASIPCVTTDVGSCREIIEGLPEEAPNSARPEASCVRWTPREQPGPSPRCLAIRTFAPPAASGSASGSNDTSRRKLRHPNTPGSTPVW